MIKHDIVDKIGKAIQVGDFVAFTTGAQGNDSIQFGTVTELVYHENKFRTGAKIRAYSTNRTLPNPRNGSSILVMNEYKEANAEYFI